MTGPGTYPIRAMLQRKIAPLNPAGRADWVPAGYCWMRMEPKKGEFQAPSGQNKAYFRAFTPLPHNPDPIDKQIDISMRFVARGKQYEISFVAVDEGSSEILIDCSSSRSASVT